MSTSGTDNSRITGFHHVALHVADLDRSVAFWTETFGFTVKLRWNIGDHRQAVMLDTGDGNYLEFFTRADNDPAGPRSDGNTDHAFAHIALRCNGIDALIDKARAAGMKITMEPRDVQIPNTADAMPTSVPVRIAFFVGPDGEVVELSENALT